jgi:hypothetical protein
MRSLRDMSNPYQHVPEVSMVRTDTCKKVTMNVALVRLTLVSSIENVPTA